MLLPTIPQTKDTFVPVGQRAIEGFDFRAGKISLIAAKDLGIGKGYPVPKPVCHQILCSPVQPCAALTEIHLFKLWCMAQSPKEGLLRNVLGVRRILQAAGEIPLEFPIV